MTDMSATPRMFNIRVTYLSGGEPFATETFTIAWFAGADPAAVAAELAEQSPYWNERIPDLGRAVDIEPDDPEDPDPTPPAGAGAIAGQADMRDAGGDARAGAGMRTLHPPDDGRLLEIGRYVVLSTAHLRCATAEQLTAWARMPPSDQPLAVASTQHGWFLPTGESSAMASVGLPDEIPAILAFGRDQGCGYVLLDCDGDCVATLPVFPW